MEHRQNIGSDRGNQWVVDTEIRGVTYSGLDANNHYDAPHFDAYLTNIANAKDAPFATRWADGSVSYSVYPYEGVDYGDSPVMTSEFNSNYLLDVDNSIGEELDDDDPWYIGSETTGHKPDDYELNSAGDTYVLASSNGGNNDADDTDPDTDDDADTSPLITSPNPNATVTGNGDTSSSSGSGTDEILDELADVVNDILDNDGRTLELDDVSESE
jgi:hypothetical protein